LTLFQAFAASIADSGAGGPRWPLVMGTDWSAMTVSVKAAESPEARVCTMRTTAFVVALVRAGIITADEGWTAIADMQAARRSRLRAIPWADRAGFDALCTATGFDAAPPMTGDAA
jgi:hypothetical protein